MRAYGQTQKRIAAFRNIANAPKKLYIKIKNIIYPFTLKLVLRTSFMFDLKKAQKFLRFSTLFGSLG